MLGQLIGGFVVIIVGANLIAPVADQIYLAKAGGNVTGAASTLLDLVTLFFSLSIVSAGIATTVQGLRASGLVGV